ncbi:ATP-dependent RNA helicase DHX36, partial [Paramuricea clavata]
PPQLSIQQDGRHVKVEVHPKSVNCSERSFHSNWLIYLEKIKSTMLFIHDCSTVTPYSLLFFGGEISVGLDEDQEIVTVDHWIKFNCRNTVAILVQRLRAELERLFEEKIRCPSLAFALNKKSGEDRQSVLIRTVIDLITSE